MRHDPVNHPDHYAGHYTHEVIELTARLNFVIGNIWKYLLRSPYKGQEQEDLKKAQWYARYAFHNGIKADASVKTLELMFNFYADLRLNKRHDLASIAANLMCEDWPSVLQKLAELAWEKK